MNTTLLHCEKKFVNFECKIVMFEYWIVKFLRKNCLNLNVNLLNEVYTIVKFRVHNCKSSNTKLTFLGQKIYKKSLGLKL